MKTIIQAMILVVLAVIADDLKQMKQMNKELHSISYSIDKCGK